MCSGGSLAGPTMSSLLVLTVAFSMTSSPSVLAAARDSADVGTPPARRPNFVVFLVDDLGYGDVGCFGNTSLRTPNIDSLCRDGVKLAHNLAASPVCTPSRAALLTGRYPVEIGMEASRLNRVFLNLAATGGLPPNTTTFPSVLRDHGGYSTALVGKWHLGLHCGGFPPDFCHHPNSHGFDYFYGLPLTNVRDFGNDEIVHSSVLRPFAHLIQSLWVTVLISALMFIWAVKKRACGVSLIFLAVCVAATCLLLPLHNFRAFSGVLMRDTRVIEQPVNLEGLTESFVKEAVGFLDRQRDGNEENPFLLFLAFTHVHTALIPGSKFSGRSKFGPYGDCVMEVDWAVGEVLNKLEDLNLIEDTVVYFSSDNGAHQEETMGDGTPAGGSNFPFKGGKGMGSMEGGIRVPTIIKYPRKFPAGKVINAPTSQMDLLPTFVHLAGIDVDKLDHDVVDGKDLTAMLVGDSVVSPHRVLLHFCGTYLHGARFVEDENRVWKVRFAQPKFVPGTYRCEFICFCSPGDVDLLDPPLIFNLVEDPTEEKPIDPNTVDHARVIDVVRKFSYDHSEQLERNPPEDQFSILNSIWRPWLQPCCDFGRMCSCNDDASR